MTKTEYLLQFYSEYVIPQKEICEYKSYWDYEQERERMMSRLLYPLTD